MDKVNESCYSKTTVLHAMSDLAWQLYYYVQFTGHFVCRSNFYIKRSYFDSYLLLYTLRGNAVLHYRNKIYNISANTILLIDCKYLHEYYPVDDNWEFKYVHFNGAAASRYYVYITQLYDSVLLPAFSNIENYMDTLYRLTAESGPEEICSDYLYRILTNLIYHYRVENDLTHFPEWLTQAIKFISDNYQKELQINDLSELCHFNRCYFSTLFKKYTGFAPRQYIANYRIAEAKHLLYSTMLSIDTIAHQCGFQNTSSFIRSFKKREGVSPLVYRKSKGIHAAPENI